MSVNKFKVGDVVKCVDAGILNNLTAGKEYVLLDVSDDGEPMVENDKGSSFYYCSHRFELSDDSANTPQPPKFKEGDMVYLIGFNCLKPHKLLAKINNDSPMKFKVEVTIGDELLAEAWGSTIKEAEFEAAGAALEKIRG